MGIFGSKEKVILVEDQGRCFREAKLKKTGLRYYDPVTGKVYLKTEKTVIWNGKRIPLLDADKGVALHPEIDENVLRLKTTPELIKTILEPAIIQSAFKIKPDLKQILAAFIIGIVIGIIFFAPVI